MSLYGILISLDHYEAFTKDLTPEGVGNVIIALMETYLFGKEPENLVPVESAIYRYLKMQVDVSVTQHERRVEASKKANEARWRNAGNVDVPTVADDESERMRSDANGCERMRTDAVGCKYKNKNKNKNKDKYIKEKDKKEKSPGLDGIMEEFPLTDRVKETVRAFVEMRKAIRSPMTDRAIRIMLTKLFKLSRDEETQIAILEQSIMSSWKGIFPLEDGRQWKQKKEVAPFFRQINSHDHGQDYNALISQMVKGGD